jgi:flagellar export protein FliJ
MYRFRLETLLNHRCNQVETCQKELAQARRRLHEEQEKLNRKKRQERRSWKDLQGKRTEKASVSAIKLHMNYLSQLSKDIENQALRVHKRVKLVDHKRHELISVMQKRDTLKKIKSRDWQAYQKKLMQDQRKLMDEFSSNRHVRKM